MITHIINKQLAGQLSRTTFSQLNTKKQFIDRFSKRQYLEVLGMKKQDKPNLKGKDLHRAYLNQIKKYHSDKVHGEESKVQFQEITKYITQAYQELKKQDPTYWSSGNKQQTQTLEDKVAWDLFGKHFSQIKHTMYSEENKQMRADFVQEVSKRRKQSSSQQNNQNSGNQYRNTNYSSSSSQSSKGVAGLSLVALGCLALIPFFLNKSSPSTKIVNSQGKQISIDEQADGFKVKEYSQKELNVIQLNTQKIKAKPLQKFYNDILRKRPHMISYPTGKDPDILEQLINYSIAPDIHLYEVPSKYFLFEDDFNTLQQSNSVENLEKYQMKEVKPNTLLTLSLEAERALQNVYIKVNDVLAEIKEKGSYTPPKILFKFHGYIMFEIRNKPFGTLQGYRNSKYISLFDLYFDYYSPIFFKRSYFNSYLTGFQEDAKDHTRYFGNVYLNHHSMPCRYIQKDQKVVILRELSKCYNKFNKLKEVQIKYREAWQNYYLQHEKKWKQYHVHQIPTQM